MQTLILVSFIIASVVAPAWTARQPSARRGIKQALFVAAGAAALYLAVLQLFYARHFIPDWSP